MQVFPRTFTSNVNGARFDVDDQLTASLLMKSEKKEYVRVERQAPKANGRNKNAQNKTDTPDDNETEIA